MVEVHPDPDSALSDSEQQLTIEEFEALMVDLVPVHEHVSDLEGVVMRPAVHLESASGAGLSKH